MASQAEEDEIVFELKPFIRVYKSGRVERSPPSPLPPSAVSWHADTIPASIAVASGGISSRDVVIDPDTGVSARLFVPEAGGYGPGRLLPLLVYYHGGAFCIGSPFMRTYHDYVSSLVARANVVAVSVHYRLAPEHPIPAAYEDSWVALRWAVSGTEPWLAERADLGRVFLAGDSAGGNIVHHLAMRAGAAATEEGIRIHGIVLIQPYLLGSDRVESEARDPETTTTLRRLWEMAAPGAGVDDPWINPVGETAGGAQGRLRELGARRAMVCLAGEDAMSDRGRAYCEKVRESGWGGEVELHEVAGKGHSFHLLEPSCEEALQQDLAITRFLNRE